MKIKYFILPLVLLLLAISSCKTEVNYKGEITEPLLVVFADAVTNGFPKVTVSKSAFFLNKINREGTDTINYKPYLLADALVQYSVNNGAWISMTYDAKEESYLPDYKTASRLQPDDKLTVSVSHPDFPSTSASQLMPEKVDIALVEVKVYDKINNKGDTVCEYHLTYHIYPSEDKTLVGRLSLQDSYLKDLPLMSNDILFQELNYDINNQNWREIIGTVFSFEEDELEDYREHLDFRMSEIPESGKDIVVVTRAPIAVVNDKVERKLKGVTTNCNFYSAETYLYLNSMRKYKGTSTGMLGLEEKVQVYGNFSNGTIGCLTAKSYITYMTMFKEE